MFNVNVPKLRGKIAERGYNLTTLADELQVNRTTLSRYLAAPERMPYGIINLLARQLCETPEEAEQIFFAPDLRGT